MAQALKVFINYRRADSQDFVEKLFPWLYMRYGAGNVFVDYTSIPEFERFEDFIRHKIRESDVVISIIGPTWLDHVQDRAERGEKDYVLIELEEAISNGKIIAPICVNGAHPPHADALPPTIRTVLDNHIAELPNARAIVDNIDRICKRFEHLVNQNGAQRIIQGAEFSQEPNDIAVLTLDEAVEQFNAAYTSEDWAAALSWYADIQSRNMTILPGLAKALSRRVDYCREQFQLAEEARQRQELTDYLYRQARFTFQLDGTPEEVLSDLAAVWDIQVGYDPDQIAAQLAPIPAMLPSPFEWCFIPGGEVHIEAGGYVPKGGKTFTVAPFWMAKYCITNAQYEVFVQAKDGYANAGWWDFSPAAQTCRSVYQQPKATGFAGDTLPRTDVSWYEALAFCRWLSAQTGQTIALPTEQQWQFAAQGTDGHKYPWGNKDPTPELMNYDKNVGKPTPVDAYPAGASPFGVLNMAGNVWEWCITGWKSGDQNGNSDDNIRLVRGGSWCSDRLSAACALRSHVDSPYFGSNPIGFRVVVVPL